MAFAFGDSYLKLPPITGESAVEIDEKNSKRSSSGAVRDKNGLVRLPPIVRLDSLRSPPSTAQVFPRTPAENESEMSTQGSSLKISHKMDVLRQGSSKKLRQYATEKHEDDIEKLINAPATKETDEVDKGFLDSEDWSYQVERPRRFRTKERSRGLQGDQETMALYKDRLASRRGSAAFKPNSVKLSRSCRLAKSSPELCSRKINLKYRASGNDNDSGTVTSHTAGLSPGSCSRTSQARLSIHDIDGSVLSHLQNTAKIDEKVTKHEKRGRSLKGGSTYQPLSTPNSPVCSESANKEYKQKGRKSLNDITETVKEFIDRRRPSISPPKKQNLVDETAGLKIEGKSCPQAEKEIVGEERVLTVSLANSLHPPQHSDKRHSLYDLQQILNLLQIEDLKRQSSLTSSPPQSSSAASNGSDTSKPTNASDLREFLKLAVAAETSSGKEIKTPSTNKLSGDTTQGGRSSAHLLSPKQEQQNQSDGARKSSIYDLMGFLSLGSAGDFGSASTSENSSRSTSPRPLFSPRSSTDELLSVSEPAKARRSSTYDLLEFLSLPRSGANSRPDSGQSSSSLQRDKPKTNNPENEERETARNSREARSLSVYDLAEYLSKTSGVPPFVRVTPSDEEQTENRETVLESTGGEKIDASKRDSVYDLSEMLNIMQREHETKRESMYNLPEILSYIHREASAKSQELETNNESVNSCEEKKDPLASPSPPTVSSGYSSDSPLSITDSNSLQANDNTSSRQMSVYDLREFLSLYAAQQFPPNQQIPPSFRRKPSNASQSGVSIHVTDESNKSLQLETDDVFLPVPAGDTNSPETRKRSSVYDLAEFLSILNADDSPLRRRLSSVPSASSRSTESESESNQPRLKSDTCSAGSNFGANESVAASRPQLSPRQDSGGNVSLYDLGEFLSLLNTDEAPLRRRLSSAGDYTTQDDSRAPMNDSEKSPLYSLGEILSVLNDFEQKRVNENAAGESELGSSDEISIPVPLLAPKNEKTNTQTYSSKNRLTSQKSLTRVPGTSEVKTRLSL